MEEMWSGGSGGFQRVVGSSALDLSGLGFSGSAGSCGRLTGFSLVD